MAYKNVPLKSNVVYYSNMQNIKSKLGKMENRNQAALAVKNINSFLNNIDEEASKLGSNITFNFRNRNEKTFF